MNYTHYRVYRENIPVPDGTSPDGTAITADPWLWHVCVTHSDIPATAMPNGNVKCGEYEFRRIVHPANALP